MIKEEKKVRNTSAYPSLVNSLRANTINSMKRKIKNNEEDNTQKIIKEEEQKEKSLKNKQFRKTTNRFYNVRRKFFLTNDGQKGKLKNKGMGVIKEENDANNSSNKNNSFNKKYFTIGNNKLNNSFDKYSSKDLNSID